MHTLPCARLVAGVFMLLLCACSTPQNGTLRSVAASDLPAQIELNSVAYYAQEEYQCGPAALAMVFENAGLNITPGQLKEFLYIPDKHGTLQVEMQAAARFHGLLAYQLQPELHQILTEISAGNPVVVLQNLGLDWYPLWHYAVAIGYDMKSQEIILRSGSVQRLVLSFKTFENTWARGNYWAMTALPAERIPETARPDDFIRSIAALHHSSPETNVWPAYIAALKRWPENLLVSIAAGNQAYHNGDLRMSEQIFFNATQQHPDAASAFNNLAQTLSDQGLYDSALRAALRALEIGGPLQSLARQTLSEIEQKKRAAQEDALK